MTTISHISDSGKTGMDDSTGASIIHRLAAHRKSIAVLVALVCLSGCRAKSPIAGKSVAELEAMLKQGDSVSQAQGALGLSRLGPEAATATPTLIDGLKSPHTLVRQNSALALGHIGPDAKS